MAKINGVELYRGPSVTGEPIVVILTGLNSKSDNRKTGGMLQTWILRADVSPIDAIRNGQDTAVCGTCPHRSRASGGQGSCYVNVGQAPRSIYGAWTRGKYPRVSAFDAARIVAGRKLRLGAYGDPGAVPDQSLWGIVASGATEHTGYTHQWRTATHLRGLVMASADTVDEAREAQGKGWATFRVAAFGDAHREKGEARCPASEEAGKRVTCESCPIKCNGQTAKGMAGRVIQDHGRRKTRLQMAA